MPRLLGLVAAVCFVILLVGAAQEAQKTREETLLEQVAMLQLQLAQVGDAWHKCEANGPQAAQLQQAGQATVKALVQSLAARKLTLDKDGKVVPLAEPDNKKAPGTP